MAFLIEFSFLAFFNMYVPLDLQKMSYNLYVSKVVFATIISRSLVILLNSISFNEMVKAYIFKQRTNMRKVRPSSMYIAFAVAKVFLAVFNKLIE
jgi:hypothetical protein